jgi:hypothetical protein
MQNMTIRFVRHWRGRNPGDIDTSLDLGVAVELLRRGIAEPVVAASTAPMPVPTPQDRWQKKRK